MNSIFDRVSLLLRLSALLPLAAGVAVLSGIWSSAQAEMANTLDKATLATPSRRQEPLSQVGIMPSLQNPVAAAQTANVALNRLVVSAAGKSIVLTTPVGNTQLARSDNMAAASNSKPAQLTRPIEQPLSLINTVETEAVEKPSLRYTPATPATAPPSGHSSTQSTIPAPIPGKTLTSAAILATGSPMTGQFAEPTTKTSVRKVAQTGISPGRITRGGSSYVGIAGNFGIGGGGTSLGNTNFTVISKIGLTNSFSVRPAVVIGDDATFLIPLTYDFNISSADAFSESLPFSPYLGAGIAVSTRSDDNVAALLSAGVDVPLSSQFTATAGLNVGFFKNTDIGLLVGVGYNFVGLGI